MSNRTRKHIKKELEKLKQLKARASKPLNVEGLRAMEGFKHISDELAKEILRQLREYASIVLLYINQVESKKKMKDGG